MPEWMAAGMSAFAAILACLASWVAVHSAFSASARRARVAELAAGFRKAVLARGAQAHDLDQIGEPGPKKGHRILYAVVTMSLATFLTVQLPSTTADRITVKLSAAVAKPYIHYSSQPSKVDADAAMARLLQRNWGKLPVGQVSVLAVDLGAKGTWYRVILEVGTFEGAIDGCRASKALGIDCVAIDPVSGSVR